MTLLLRLALIYLALVSSAFAVPSRQAQLLINYVPPPLATWDFTRVSPETYGFTNVRAGTYYSINAAGDYAPVPPNTSNWASYGVTPWLGNTLTDVNLGMTVWSAYTVAIKNNSMQGAVVGNSTELTTNGNFALNPIAGAANTVLNGWQWAKSGALITPTWVAGAVTITGPTARLTSDVLATTPGASYTITADISAALAVWVGTTNGGQDILNQSSALSGQTNGQTFTFVATTTTTWVSFNNANATPSVVANVSVRQGMQPTNWEGGTQVESTNIGTLAPTVTALATTNGIDTITETIAGRSAGAGFYQMCFENQVASNASSGQYFGEQAFLQIVGGDLTGISSITLDMNEIDHNGFVVQRDQSAALTLATSGSFAQTLQFSLTQLSGGGTVEHSQPCVAINYGSAQDINISIKIGWPMDGSSNFPQPTTPMRTTTAFLSSGSDNVTIPTASILGFPNVVTRFASVSEVYIPVNNAQSPSFTGSSPFSIDSGSSSNRYASGMGTSGGGPVDGTASAVVVGGVIKAIQDGRIHSAGRTIHCFASIQSTTEASLALDGGPTSFAWGASDPIPFTTIRIGRNSNGTNIFDGYIRRMKIWPNLPANVTASMLSRQCGD